MKSVADSLRAEDVGAVRSLTAQMRVDFALRLGDDDVEVYGKARGLDRGAAFTELRRRRQEGRRLCRCLRESPA